MQLGSEHSLVTLPSSTADFFEYNDFAGRAEDFVHYGSSSQVFRPAQLPLSLHIQRVAAAPGPR
jgi:hypothetical protein